MLRRILAAAGALSLLFIASTTAGADNSDDRATTAQDAPATTDYAIVSLQSPAAASYAGGIPGYARTKPERARLDPTSPAYRAYVRFLENEHADYRAFLTRHAPEAQVLREFFVVGNAIAVRLNGASPQTLARGPKVRAVAPSTTYQLTMNVSNDLIRSSELWTGGEGGATGEGVKVAIIDTGIDLTNVFFSDTGLATQDQVDECPDKDGDPTTGDTNNKVIVCRVYASGNAPGASAPHVTLAFDHGTHVAGTVAGRSGTTGTVEGTDVTVDDLSGVAPDALLGDYNVFPGFGAGFVGKDGEAFSHDIAAALEDAVLDGMDVANLSLGGTVQGPHDFLAEASNAAVDAGMVVVIAAGNEGPGDSTVSSPGSAEKVITAGATTNPHFVGISVAVEDGPSFGAALGDFENFDPALTAAYTVTTPANGCAPISEDLAGTIALIDRGVCTFTTKIRNAEAAGAIGVLVANNVAGDPTAMAHDGTDPFPVIPAAMVGKAEGATMKPTGTATVDGTAPGEILSANADIVAGFSSRGPTPFTYSIKPDVTAPGVNVLSGVFDGEFAFFQGTSMATPHTAGAAALLLELYENATPAEVKSRLANNAARTVTDHVDGAVDPGPLARGGGRIDVVDAAGAGAWFDPVSVSNGLVRGNKPIALSRTISTHGDVVTSAAVNSAAPLPPGFDVSTELGEGFITVSLAASRTVPNGDYSGDVIATAGGQEYLIPFWVRVTNR